MIENIAMATKSEIQREMENLNLEFEERKEKLAKKMDNIRKFIQKEDEALRKLSEDYTALENELNKREGKKIDK